VRRLVAIVLVGCAAAAATMVLGPAIASDRGGGDAEAPRLTAAAKPFAGLNATFAKIAKDAKCAAGKAKAAQARKLRAAANKNAAKATPKQRAAKRKQLRRAIALIKAARKLCKEAAQPGGTTPGTPGTPGTPTTPPPPPPPPPPGVQLIALGTAPGTTLAYSPNTPVTASASAPIRLQVTNNSSIGHRIGARTGPGGTVFGQTDPATTPGNSSSVDVTLAAGSYQIFCGQPGHAAGGMTVSLTVSP
jgi:hypothetical protein